MLHRILGGAVALRVVGRGVVEYVAFLLATRRVKTNGLTPHEHLRGKQFVQPPLCFGEKCLWKLRGRVPNAKRAARQSLDGNEGSSWAPCARPTDTKCGTWRRDHEGPSLLQ